MSEIRLAPNLRLPIEAVTETFAILAKRGKGKTNTAVVMTEEMINAGQQVVVVDPVGVWWGLRSSASGTDTGLPVVVFGGDHGHLPLEETAGELIADVVIENQMSVVIDLSLLRKGANKRFMTDFIERLYHRNRQPLHVVVDEADAFAPQRAQADGARLLGAMEDLVRRGRARGIGCTLITQRPAVINKDVLTQAEVLICLGMTGVQDINAIDAWVKQHADEGEAAKVKASLPSLPVGTAWVWSPGWLGALKQVKIRKRRTYDSSATPKPGVKLQAPKRFAEVDLAALGERIQATVEKQKATDPKELQKRIRELERQVAAGSEALESANRYIEEVKAQDERLREALESANAKNHQPHIPPEMVNALTVLGESLTTSVERIDRMLGQITDQDTRPEPIPSPPPRSAPAKRAPASLPRAPAPRIRTETATDFAGSGLSKSQVKILNALAWFESVNIMAPTRGQIAFQARVSPKSSGFEKNCSTLRSRGLVDYPGANRIGLTTEGRAVAEQPERPGTSADLQQAFYEGVSTPQATILQVLVDIHPDPIDRQSLADAANVSPVSSGFEKNLSTLRSLGLADYPSSGLVVATDMLFID